MTTKKIAGKVDQSLWLGKSILFLEKGMILGDQDLVLLDKWKLNLEEGEKVTNGGGLKDGFYQLNCLKNEFELYNQFEKELTEHIKNIFSKIKNRQNFIFPNPKKFIDSLNDNLFTSASFLFFLNTRNRSPNIETIAFLTCCYATLSALKIKIDLKLVEQVFNASIIVDSYFVLSSADKLEKDLLLDLEQDELDLTFLKTHCIKGYQELLSSSKLEESYLKAVLSHHEYHNKKGCFSLDPNKVPLFVKFITVAHEYVYFTSHFFKNMFTPILPSQAIALMMKRSSYYYPKILQNFVLMLSIYPPGAVVRLNTSKVKNSLAISIATGKSIKETFFVLLGNDQNQPMIDYPVVSLTDDPNLKILGIVNGLERKEWIKTFYQKWFHANP